MYTLAEAAKFLDHRQPARYREFVAQVSKTFTFDYERANRLIRFALIIQDYRNNVPVAQIKDKYSLLRTHHSALCQADGRRVSSARSGVEGGNHPPVREEDANCRYLGTIARFAVARLGGRDRSGDQSQGRLEEARVMADSDDVARELAGRMIEAVDSYVVDSGAEGVMAGDVMSAAFAVFVYAAQRCQNYDPDTLVLEVEQRIREAVGQVQ